MTGETQDRNSGKPSWRIIVTTLLYCAGMGIYAVAQGPAMATAVLMPLITLASAVIGSYVFGAVWDDRGR